MADVLDHREVVGDEQVGEPVLLLQVEQKVDHLGLDRDVERRDRLVAHDQARVERQREGDADPLALPAGELVRILGRSVGREPDPLRRPATRSSFSCPAATPWLASGSPTIAPADMRGLSDE